MSFRRDTKSRRTDRTPDHGWSGRAAARQDAEALRSGSRAWLADAGCGSIAFCAGGECRREAGSVVLVSSSDKSSLCRQGATGPARRRIPMDIRDHYRK
jgi:hypothetical protein